MPPAGHALALSAQEHLFRCADSLTILRHKAVLTVDSCGKARRLSYLFEECRVQPRRPAAFAASCTKADSEMGKQKPARRRDPLLGFDRAKAGCSTCRHLRATCTIENRGTTTSEWSFRRQTVSLPSSSLSPPSVAVM